MTGGGPHTTIEQRYGHIREIAEAGALTMGIVDPGSVNLGRFESDGAPSADETIYLNSYADTRHMVDTCVALELPISFSIFDGSFMRTAVAYVRSGRIRHGGQIKIFFGSDFAPFGIPAGEAGLLAAVGDVEQARALVAGQAQQQFHDRLARLHDHGAALVFHVDRAAEHDERRRKDTSHNPKRR